MFRSKLLFIVFIISTITAAWFSIGFYQVDEHFQILEFGAYAAGKTQAANLPWEFSSAIRSALQPWLVYLVIEALNFFGTEDPFLAAFLLRILTAILCIAC